MNWEEALIRIPEWRHISFRYFQSCVHEMMKPLHCLPENSSFFCCSEAILSFNKRTSKPKAPLRPSRFFFFVGYAAEGGCGPTTYVRVTVTQLPYNISLQPSFDEQCRILRWRSIKISRQMRCDAGQKTGARQTLFAILIHENHFRKHGKWDYLVLKIWLRIQLIWPANRLERS